MDPGIRGGLRRGRDVGPADGGNGLPKTLLIGGGAALLALGVAVASPWAGSRTDAGPNAPAQVRGPVTIEAEALQKAYQDDPVAAAARFDGREMVVSGEFLRIVPDGYGSLDLRLKTANPDAQLGIDIAQLAIEDAKQLRPGQRVTVSCQGMGGAGEELWVRDCAIQFEGPAAPLPADAPPPPEEQE